MAIAQRRIKGAFAPPTPTLPILDALNNAFVSIRQHNPEIPNVVIVVGTSSSTKLGHFSARTWDGKANTVHEIVVTGESLRRGAADVFATLLHEAAHVYAHVSGIKDTSRQGKYHNKKFKEIGEKLGLVLEQHQLIGWSLTSLSAEALKTYSHEIALIRKALKAYRVPSAVVAKPRTTLRLSTKSGRKLTVPIRFYQQGGIFDENTGERFTPVDEGWEDENGPE